MGGVGDGNVGEDGIYVVLKEVVEKCMDELKMGGGGGVEMDMEENVGVRVGEYGGGIGEGKVVEGVRMVKRGGK